jgi:hypothetical protein
MWTRVRQACYCVELSCAAVRDTHCEGFSVLQKLDEHGGSWIKHSRGVCSVLSDEGCLLLNEHNASLKTLIGKQKRVLWLLWSWILVFTNMKTRALMRTLYRLHYYFIDYACVLLISEQFFFHNFVSTANEWRNIILKESFLTENCLLRCDSLHPTPVCSYILMFVFMLQLCWYLIKQPLPIEIRD